MTEREHHTFLFADLCGFTALTETHGDEQAADLAASFYESLRELLPRYGGEEVKAIGDALMIRTTDANSAVSLAMRAVQDLGAQHGFPAVRAGVHTGPAVERDGDWFGGTVNIAARVSELAAGGEVLATAATREAVRGELPDVDFRARGRQELKNVTDRVEVYEVVASSGPTAGDLPVDPVCRMAVDPDRSPHRRVFRGVEYHFCSGACAEAFDQRPTVYGSGGRSRSNLRVSDDARERAAGVLKRAYGKGRITADELEQRLERAYQARTRADMKAVLVDLPGARRALRRGGRQRFLRRLLPGRRSRRRRQPPQLDK